VNRWIIVACLPAALIFAQAPAPSPKAQLENAAASVHAGKIDTAVKQYEALLRANPPREIAGQAHLDLARIYQAQGDWWQASRQWEALRKLAPDEPEYAYQLGLAYQYLSKSAFEKLLAAAPQSARAHQLVGEQLARMGRNEKAVDAFQRALAADPKLEGTHLALAVIYLQSGKPAEALVEIDEELKIAPESVAAKQIRQAVAGKQP
jgi:tetratricopeptide (TPR) repeat protein